MMPVILSFGPVKIYSFGFMVALGIALSLWLISRSTKGRTAFPTLEHALDMVFIGVLAGFIGARLYYIFQNAETYWAHPALIFAVWEGGLIFYGGLPAVILGLFFYLRQKKVPVLKGFDFFVPYVALTHAFGRIGCFLNGCCYGCLSDLPWAVSFPSTEPSRVHPTQLYEALANAGFYFLLKRFEKTPHRDGAVFFLYLCLYSLERFLMEFLRVDNPKAGLLTFNQWICLVVLIFGAAGYRRVQKPAAPVAAKGER